MTPLCGISVAALTGMTMLTTRPMIITWGVSAREIEIRRGGKARPSPDLRAPRVNQDGTQWASGWPAWGAHQHVQNNRSKEGCVCTTRWTAEVVTTSQMTSPTIVSSGCSGERGASVCMPTPGLRETICMPACLPVHDDICRLQQGEMLEPPPPLFPAYTVMAWRSSGGQHTEVHCESEGPQTLYRLYYLY